MHPEILTRGQAELLPYLKQFKRSYYLVGGTAVALHIGHRRSVDFDLFTLTKINKSGIRSKLLNLPFKQVPVFEDFDQLHLVVNDIKLTFFSYPYQVTHDVNVGSFLKMPSLLSLAAMKAFALGRRAKWKDYVDLYFILHDYYSIEEISIEAGKIFNQQFSEKLFRQQLAFHKDIDYSEHVEYTVASVPDDEIREFLIDRATEMSF